MSEQLNLVARASVPSRQHWDKFEEEAATPRELATPALNALNSRMQAVKDPASLREFLETYRNSLLVPLELDAITKGHGFASRNELRELIEYDRSLRNCAVLGPVSEASRHIGRRQLKALRPLRDVRFVQRYLKAVESSEANGWHMVVFGAVLFFYGVPLRQGLIHYGNQTVRGFMSAASDRVKLSEPEIETLHSEVVKPLPQAVERLIGSEIIRIK